MNGRYVIGILGILLLGMVPGAVAQNLFLEKTTFDLHGQNVSIELGKDYQWGHTTVLSSALRIDEAYIEVVPDTAAPVHLVLEEYDLHGENTVDHPVIKKDTVLFRITANSTADTTTRFNITHVPDPADHYVLRINGRDEQVYQRGGDITWELTLGAPTKFSLVDPVDTSDASGTSDDTDTADDPTENPGTDTPEESDPVEPDDPDNTGTGTDTGTETGEDPDTADPDDTDPDASEADTVDGSDDADESGGGLLSGLAMYVLIAVIGIGVLTGGVIGYRRMSRGNHRSGPREQPGQQRRQTAPQRQRQQQWQRQERYRGRD